jgi:uncharacterized alkaline shock family protein YloU
MVAKMENEYGSIMVASDVIANLAGDAATRCYGVVGMANRNAAEGIVALLKKDSQSKGIKITIQEDGIVIELHVIIEYGINLKVICDSIIKNVRYQVETTTGFKVKSVNVNVDGIRQTNEDSK